MRLHTMILLPSLIVVMLATGCAQPIRGTETALPGSTAILTEPLTPTPTLNSTNMPNAIPTLPEKQARSRLLELLANNGGCYLPCLWGITPGITTNLESRAILLPLSGISISTHLSNNSPDSIWPTYTEGELKTSADLRYIFESDGVISRIAFQVGEFQELPDRRSPIYDSKTFGERLRPYMLPGILSEFGKPASVVIHTYGKQLTGSGGFEIVLLYPDQGMLVHYTTQMKTVGVNAVGCPANAQVELELYPSGDADSFAKSLSSTIWGAFVLPEPIDDSHWKPIDKANSMSLEQFYETFRQPTEKCIETPLKGWYVPNQ